jgi:acyl-CoA synthetase (AMP-forming)/AMP-acid ligase II
MSREWAFSQVIDAIADAVPDREMIVWRDVRRTYEEVRERTERLARFFAAQGLGLRRERVELARWECGQSPVAVVLSNCPEYLETMYGSFRARAVPFNVNPHYAPGEVAALLDQMHAEAVVYHRRLGPLLAATDRGDRVLIDVDDGSGVAPLVGSTTFADAIVGAPSGPLPDPSADDLYLVCTGGTTGRPKGVLWRQGDAYVAAMRGTEDATPESIAAQAVAGGQVWFAIPPLMHAAAQWTTFSALHLAGTVVLHDDSGPFDADAILATAARERAVLMTLVGDAYAVPVIEALRTGHHDLSALAVIAIGGAFTSPAHKQQLLELLPHVVIMDGYGSSETGGMAFGASTVRTATARFRGGDGAVVLSADRGRLLEPGEDETGWTARRGRVPLGYLDDPAATRATFPVVDGVRFAVPGDRARVEGDGSIMLLGRDSLVVNSGGEKVYVEEVEEVLRTHPDVLDALVVGRPNERFGEEVVALVQLRPGSALTGIEVRDYVGTVLARFKAPRAVRFCDRIGRHPTGKGDYGWARAAAVDAEAVAR